MKRNLSRRVFTSLATAVSPLAVAELGSAKSGPVGDGTTNDFDSRRSAEAAFVLPHFTFLRTAGHTEAGDGGAALYRKTSSDPTHGGKFRSADGAWWELAETVVTVQMFGARGSGSVDDTDALNEAAKFCRGQAHVSAQLVLPKGLYFVADEVDFTGVRHIQCLGEIRSSVATPGQAAVTLGSESNANSDMENGQILLVVRSTEASNAALDGVVGIRIRGSARCNFRLFSSGFDVNVELAPIGGVGIQYIAFNDFSIDTNGGRTGLKFNASFDGRNGWINQNTFHKANLYPQRNALPGETIGIHFAGSYGSNNNVFLHLSLEGQRIPVYMENGVSNRLMNARMETSGPVKWGRSAFGNTVESIYPNGLNSITQEWEAERPNIILYKDSVWMPELLITYEDFFYDGTIIHSQKLKNDVSLNMQFPAGTLDASKRTFTPGWNCSAYHLLRVGKGDIFRVHGDWLGGRTLLTLSARDANDVKLGRLSRDEVSYLGATTTPATRGTSGTQSSLDVVASHNNPFMFSVNRDEVKFVRVCVRAGVLMRSLFLERLVRGGQPLDAQINRGFDKGLRIMQAYAARDIADAAHLINTTDKEVGKIVRDTTNNRLLMARGSTPTSKWDVIDGSTSVTPA